MFSLFIVYSCYKDALRVYDRVNWQRDFEKLIQGNIPKLHIRLLTIKNSSFVVVTGESINTKEHS